MAIRQFRDCREGRTSGNGLGTSAFATLLELRGLLAIFALCLSLSEPVFAQGGVPCSVEGADFSNPPEIVTSQKLLQGTIFLSDERQRIPRSIDGVTTCSEQMVRAFRPQPPKEPRDRDELLNPMPGPTLRGRVGDIVQLKFINQIDPGRFSGGGLEIDDCTEVPGFYPGKFDDYPNCLHASSTANIHFHGTHTNPNSTGDNVYLQIPPLPRDNQGTLTTTAEQAAIGLDIFFARCRSELKNPVNSWPVSWDHLPRQWVDKQRELLAAHQQKHSGDKHPQPVLDRDEEALKEGTWPIYYIGAFPYCFALPEFPGAPGAMPVMGQAPGTHWYHAHKHGSTAINVANGMTGAFIIEGAYDDDLNSAYSSYRLTDDVRWDTRSQPILVLNQLGTVPNVLKAGEIPRQENVDFTVNGKLRPKLHMQPGEVQLWRIVNTSGRTAAYFMPPKGLQWRQLAQDGVQLNDANYQDSLNKPLYVAPANRVDLLVKAPTTPGPAEIRVQNVMGRSGVKPTPQTGAAPGVVLLTVDVSGRQVMRDGLAAEMQFLPQAPKQPDFLKDISDDEMRQHNFGSKQFVFNSINPMSPKQHTMNEIQFGDPLAHAEVTLGAVEEWTIKNLTNTNNVQFNIDHPFHIHVNPFQVVELFDPNENLIDPKTGELISDKDGNAVPHYVTDSAQLTDRNNQFASRQCYLDPKNPTTWSIAGARSVGQADGGAPPVTGPCTPQRSADKRSIWHDVFAMPAGLLPRDSNGASVPDSEGKPIVIPGYFKMRSRFVDYPGLYVMHCHILIHEDRGMMFSVEVLRTRSTPVQHH